MSKDYFYEEVLDRGCETPVHSCVTRCNGHFDSVTEVHEEFQILYMKKGKATFLVNGQRFSLEEKQALMIRSGIEHSQKPVDAEKCVYTVILLDYRFLYNEGMDMTRTHYIIPVANGRLQIPMLISNATETGSQLLKLVEEIENAGQYDSPYLEIYIRSLFYRLLYSLIGGEETQPSAQKESSSQKIERAVSYLYANPCARISVEELAVMACMSKESFYRHFKKEMDCTPVEYMTELKLKQVEALLEHSTLSIKAIAEEVGFSSANYLTRTFTEKKGITPGEYRKRINEETVN